MLSDFVYNWKYDSDFYFKQVNVNHNNYKCKVNCSTALRSWLKSRG